MPTWYVRTDGSDANTPTGNETPPIDGNVAFQTIEWALNSGNSGNQSLQNGDEIRICADAVYTSSNSLSGQIEHDTVGGTIAAPLTITGAAADGTVDGTRPILDFDTLSGSGFRVPSTIPSSQMIWQHLDIRNTGLHGLLLQDGNASFHFYNVRVTGCLSGTGIVGSASQRVDLTCINCEIADNLRGVGNTAAGTVAPCLWNCSIHDNLDWGVAYASRSAPNAPMFGCLIYDNVGIGVNITSGDQTTSGVLYAPIMNCTIDGNGDDGVFVGTLNPGMIYIVNTVISNNTGAGVNTNNQVVQRFRFQNMWLWNNSGGRFDGVRELVDFPFANDCVDDTDPLYTSRADGAENYEPQAASGLIGAGQPGVLVGGTGHMDVGALQRQMAIGGAGGLITHPGMTGGIRG